MKASVEARLRVVQTEPFNAEAPIGVLGAPVTPVASFFVRSNFAVPLIDADAWRLNIGGLVRKPASIGLRDLQALGRADTTAVMECAGNGRRLMSPVPGGTPWELGAVSTGVFTGVPLARVMALCGVDAGAVDARGAGADGADARGTSAGGIDARAVELVFRGADSGALDDGRIVHFERSLPVARALDPGTLLVWALNGEPLTPAHGHPVRLIVPGYYGVASVKWLERITAVAAPFAGHFQAERYIYLGHPAHEEHAPVTRMHVRSLITSPSAGDIVRGTVMVRGLAWSGYGAVSRVQLTGDGGSTWTDACISAPSSIAAPTLWECEWPASSPGELELVARATDSSGEVQPLEPVWNALGYANNVVHRVRVRAG